MQSCWCWSSPVICSQVPKLVLVVYSDFVRLGVAAVWTRQVKIRHVRHLLRQIFRLLAFCLGTLSKATLHRSWSWENSRCRTKKYFLTCACFAECCTNQQRSSSLYSPAALSTSQNFIIMLAAGPYGNHPKLCKSVALILSSLVCFVTKKSSKCV